MSLLDRLRALVGLPPRGVRRSIARLEPGGGALSLDDVAVETVDLSGAPLKEGHRRRALRDLRLLPKKHKRTAFGFGKRKKVMTAGEALRLFGGTLRSRNRGLRDLLPDVEQLERLGLPVWQREEDVAEALGLPLRDLHFFAIHRPNARISHYVTFSIPKRSGGRRLILAPKRRLKAIQRRLLELLVGRLPVSAAAHGFVRRRSTRSAAEPHVGKKVVVRLDLRDFFPTVTFRRVRGFLVACGYGYPVATTLAVLMTEAERQPVAVGDVIYQVPVGERHCVQGAPTSPGLCNAIALRLDHRLAGLARRLGFAYSRYADDLTFSGDDPAAVKGLLALAARIVAAEGFTLNREKTRVQRRGRRQTVVGVTVNDVLGLSRRDRRRLRAALHQAARQPVTAERRAQLAGHVAYAAMLHREQAAPLKAALARVQGTAPSPPKPKRPSLPPPRPKPAAAPATPAVGVRRFEYVGGVSKKFWEISVAGNTHTVHFGRIGTAGQRKTKTFPTPAVAAADAGRLVREKLGKGYVEKG